MPADRPASGLSLPCWSVLLIGLLAASCAPKASEGSHILFSDDFRGGLSNWKVEAERPGAIRARDGILDVDVPNGVTLWFRPELQGPIAIEYDVQAVSEGGPNDAVSDVNCFWMATDPRAPDGDVLSYERSGAFADYDRLRTYYVGLGGNRNSTTRFRRYVGRQGDRPLLPGNDLRAPGAMLKPNRWQHIRLVADGPHIAFQRDGKTLFSMTDEAPYTHGHFGLRTTKSHLRFRNVKVLRLP